jgi:cytochrome c553
MKLISIVLFACACSGSSKSTMPTTPTPDPVPMTEEPPSEPANPVDPVKPVEPAQPAAPDPAKIKADLLAAEQAAFDNAKPVFDKWCAKCHSKDGKSTSAKKREHFDMTTYPFGGHHAMEISGEIRKTLGLTGKKPTMPADKKGAVQGEELELIKAWADSFDASHKGGAHEGHDQHGGGHKH